MAKSVTPSSTKAEILSAYEELLEEIKQERQQNSALQRQAEQQKKTVQTAVVHTQTDSKQTVESLKQKLIQQLDEMGTSISSEQHKFEELQAAIVVEKKTLEEIYKIKAEAESLDALVIAHRQAKEKLEKEAETRKQTLDQELEETKRKWAREKEEYEYNLKIQRRNEEDTYKSKKAQMEKDLSEQKQNFERSIAAREQRVAEQESLLEQLQKEVATFEKKMDKSVEEAKKTVTESLTKEFEFRRQLEIKDLQAELKLRDQMIESLQAKVKEQQVLMEGLSVRTDSASQQVKDIALKAIENSGNRQFGGLFDRKGEENDKSDYKK